MAAGITVPKVVTESDKCKVYLWDGVTPGAPGEPIVCDAFTPREMQVEGDFTRAHLDASCGGGWERVVSVSMSGSIAKVFTEALKVRPRVEGSESASAKFYVMVRR